MEYGLETASCMHESKNRTPGSGKSQIQDIYDESRQKDKENRNSLGSQGVAVFYVLE